MRVKLTATVATGETTATATSDAIYGLIMSIYIDYTDVEATTTVDIDEVGGPARKVLDLAAGNTDAAYYPTVELQDNTGSGTGSYGYMFIPGSKLTLSVANSDPGSVTAYIDVIEVN